MSTLEEKQPETEDMAGEVPIKKLKQKCQCHSFVDCTVPAQISPMPTKIEFRFTTPVYVTVCQPCPPLPVSQTHLFKALWMTQSVQIDWHSSMQNATTRLPPSSDILRLPVLVSLQSYASDHGFWLRMFVCLSLWLPGILLQRQPRVICPCCSLNCGLRQ